jgi:ABC-type nitrate/sulfonate/bicarbonate transport system substrate-binding protein
MSGKMRAVIFATALLLTMVHVPAGAQMKVNMARLVFPGTVTIMADVFKAQGFDKKNGIDLHLVEYGSISTYYAGLAKGEVDFLAGGAHVLQKMRNEGVPIKAVATFVRLATLVVITADPGIKSIDDLRGKSIAADMGSAEYQILAMYGKARGLTFGKDVTVVQAGPPLARTQLAAKRVDAAMTWETNATLTLRDNPQYRVVVSGETAWQTVANSSGWQLLVLVNEGFFTRHPNGVPALLKMLQDGAQFIMENPAEVDRIAQQSMKLPPGVVPEAVRSKRLVYDVQPAWGPERRVIEDMFRVAVEQGYLDKLPQDALYAP